MKVDTCFKNVDLTPSVRKRIDEDSMKLAKFFNGRFSIHWTCSKRQGEHTTQIRLIGPHFEYNTKARNGSLYKSLNDATQKMEKQLKKKKEKLRDKITRKNLSTPKHTQILQLEKKEEHEQFEQEEGVVKAA